MAKRRKRKKRRRRPSRTRSHTASHARSRVEGQRRAARSDPWELLRQVVEHHQKLVAAVEAHKPQLRAACNQVRAQSATLGGIAAVVRVSPKRPPLLAAPPRGMNRLPKPVDTPPNRPDDDHSSLAMSRGLGSHCFMDATTAHPYYMAAACRITRDLVARNPVTPDLSGDYEAVQGWPFVTVLYNGIEQALKMLLLVPSDTRFSRELLASREYGHDLAKLYSKLAPDDRDHIELHFREHLSLHDYIPAKLTGTAEEFITHINGSPNGGLVLWRYILVDGTEQVPQTSLWTMSEIWHAICCRIRNASGHGGCFRLRYRLAARFNRVMRGRVVPYDGFVDELNSWVAGGLVAAWVDLLVKANRGTLDEMQVPDRLRYELATLARDVIDLLSREPADPDEKYLLTRIQDPKQTLVWNSGAPGFQ